MIQYQFSYRKKKKDNLKSMYSNILFEFKSNSTLLLFLEIENTMCVNFIKIGSKNSINLRSFFF